MDNVNIMGLVRAKFGSFQNFANTLGWSYSKTYRLLHNKESIDLNEAIAMKDALNIDSFDEFMRLLFL